MSFCSKIFEICMGIMHFFIYYPVIIMRIRITWYFYFILSLPSSKADKKLTNSTNLSLRTTATRLQKQQSQTATPMSLPRLKTERLASPLKRLNGQSHRVSDSHVSSLANKRRRVLTDTHLLANSGETSSSQQQPKTASGGESQQNISDGKSRTRFSLRINTSSASGDVTPTSVVESISATAKK